MSRHPPRSVDDAERSHFTSLLLFCTQFFRMYYSRDAWIVFVDDAIVVIKAKENLQRCGDVFFNILIASKGASANGRF